MDDDVLLHCRSLPSPLLAVPNVTAHPSTASVPITVLLYNVPLLCGFSVGIKGLISLQRHKNTVSNGMVSVNSCKRTRPPPFPCDEAAC